MNLTALYNMGYGMYIVSAKGGEKMNGQIANTVFQITAEPPTIAISINKQNLTHQYITESKTFSVSILSKETPLKFIGQFGFKSGKETDKFKDVQYKIGSRGTPIVTENAVAFIEAEVINSMDCGTHTLFLGKIIDTDNLMKAEPMTYAYYHTVKQGTSPKTAPTYQPNQKADQAKNGTLKFDSGKKYKCKVCGYIYDPEKGDPDNGIKPGTTFENIPDNWVCPVCGADKGAFTAE